MADRDHMDMDSILAAIDEMAEMSGDALAVAAPAVATRLLGLGEANLEIWLLAHGREPTSAKVEGFRLLALHRQAARGEPSFNACRETCRELVYRYNLVVLDPVHAETADRLRLAAMVARHLALFIGGKLEVAGLGDFCCSSRPLRQADQPSTSPSPQ